MTVNFSLRLCCGAALLALVAGCSKGPANIAPPETAGKPAAATPATTSPAADSQPLTPPTPIATTAKGASQQDHTPTTTGPIPSAAKPDVTKSGAAKPDALPAETPKSDDMQPPSAAAHLASDTLVDIGTRKAGVDWPCFLGPTGDGKSPETGLLTKWPTAGPRQMWKMRLGTSYGMPVVAKGRLYVFYRVDQQSRLVCCKSETGDELWHFDYPTDYDDFYQFDNGPRCCPVVDGNRVYIFGAEGMLHCLNATDGRPIWKLDTAKKFNVVQNFFGVGSTPKIEGDLLIAQIGGSPPNSPEVRSGQTKGNGSGVVAFDKFIGAIKYQFSDQLASYSSPVMATIHGRRWGFVFARGGLIGFDPTVGKQDFFFPWRAPVIESVNASDPVVIGDEVFISEAYDVKHGSALLKVKPGACDVVWTDADRPRDKSLQVHFGTPIYLEGSLYGCSARHSPDAELRCIEWQTGKVRWSEPGLKWTSLLYVDGHFICLSEDGVIRVLKANPDKYDLVQELVLHDKPEEEDPLFPAIQPTLKRPAWAAPILSHGLLYVRGRDQLVCLEVIPTTN